MRSIATNTIVHCNPTTKIIILTTQRTGSSWMYKNLLVVDGWLPKDNIVDVGVEALKDYYDQGYKFYVATKEPIVRLVSGMDIVVRPLRIEHDDEQKILSWVETQEIFANAIDMVIGRNAYRDLGSFGALNYNCADAHMCWGTHVSGLFLESIGIPCTPLMLIDDQIILPSRSHNLDHKYLDFSTFAKSLNLVPIQNKQSNKQVATRSIRFMAYLQACTKWVGSHPETNKTGIVTPSYTVYDWLDNDQYLYNNFLDLSFYAGDKRMELAQNTLCHVLDDMWSKLNMPGIVKFLPHKEVDIHPYPWDTMFDLMYLFRGYESVLPKLYNREHSDALFKSPNSYNSWQM